MKPASNWIRTAVFFGIVIMTTSMAASPVRRSVLPLLSTQLARWNLLSAPAPAVLDPSGEEAAATAPASPQTGWPAVLDAPPPVAARSASAAVAAAAPDEAARDMAAVQPSEELIAETAAVAADAAAGASRFDVGPWRANAGGSGARAGGSSLRRLGRGEPGRARSRIASAAEEAGAGGAGSQVARAERSPTSRGSSSGPTTRPSPSDTATGIFTTHAKGLPDLSATGGGIPAGGAPLAGLATVAATPEPSTLLLLGTGLAVAGRSLRRRIRQSR
ncbi:MAG: PEP-CTERM sorting domain-containing protein [Vicinamibacterales bacterium]